MQGTPSHTSTSGPPATYPVEDPSHVETRPSEPPPHTATCASANLGEALLVEASHLTCRGMWTTLEWKPEETSPHPRTTADTTTPP